jgi:hypothetical protein
LPEEVPAVAGMTTFSCRNYSVRKGWTDLNHTGIGFKRQIIVAPEPNLMRCYNLDVSPCLIRNQVFIYSDTKIRFKHPKFLIEENFTYKAFNMY